MRRTQEEINLHNQKIMNFFNHDRKGPKNFCNRMLSSQGQTFAIHDGVLASMSGYFKKLFSTEMKEKYEENVELDRISPKRLETVLDFMYTGDVELTNENVWEILEDADYTQIHDLKSFCNKFMLGNVTTNNCLKLRKYSARYGLNDVEKKTNKMIADNIKAVVQHEYFKELDVGDMSKIIQLRDKDCEEAVFTAIVKWVNYNPHQREELFVKLFSQLDLSLMTTDFLQQVSNEGLVRNNMVCLQMLLDSYVFRCRKSLFLVIGGERSKTDCVIYNLNTKEMEQVKPNLNPGRSGLTSTRVGRKVYVMGGDEKKCEVLDLDENTWNKIPDMLEARKYCASACVGDSIYVTGGWGSEALQSCERFLLTIKQWKRMGNMLQERHHHQTVVCNGLLYCIGGRGEEGRLKSCECFDPIDKVWNSTASLHEARSALACAVLDGYIYAIGGFDGKCCLKTVERYKPDANKWEYVAPLRKARRQLSACVLQNKIYAIGGIDIEDQELTSVEVYDPSSNVWLFCFRIEKPLCLGTVVAL